MKTDKLSIYFLGIYIFLIGFQEPYHLPWFYGKIQISDLWFLLMVFYILMNRITFLHILKDLFQNQVIKYLYLIGLGYLLIIGISILNSFSTAGLILLFGRSYLLIMSFVVLLFLMTLNKENAKIYIFKIFNIFGLSLALIGIVGWTFSIFGFQNETTQIYLDYPYFGDTHRLKAYTTTPSMYVSMITICFVFGLCNYLFYNKSKFQLFGIIIFTIAAFLTFTKSFLFIGAAFISLYLFKYYKKPILISLLYLCFVIMHFFLTHFLIIPNQHINDTVLTNGPYSSNELIYSNKDYSIIGSGYYSFKKAAWQLFKQNPIIGIGPGNYNQQIAQLKEEGHYPKNLPNFDPHSTYLGALAETGLPGFITLMLLGVSILFLFSRINVLENPFSFSLLLIFCIMITEGISMDTMNFRHYWIVVSLSISQYINCQTRNQ